MPGSTSIVSTERASRYLQQLCKHFAHKVPVDSTLDAGRITIPFGRCALRTDGAMLILDVAGKSDDLDRLELVVGDHLARFALRENIPVS